MKVREAMTERVTTAGPETTLEEIAGMMKSEDTGAIPVVDEDELIGIVTDRDIVVRCVAEAGDPREMTAEDVVSENLETIDPESDVEEALELMANKQIRRLPVVDNGELVGMLSIGDVAVKQGDEEESGRALKDVSRGVKNAPLARRQPAARPEMDVRDAMQMRAEDSDRAERDEGRQLRVVSIRPDADEAARGRKKSSKSKAS